jgi:hypothetical protein
MVIESKHAMNALRKINKPISIIPQSGLPGREGVLFWARTLNRTFVGLFCPGSEEPLLGAAIRVLGRPDLKIYSADRAIKTNRRRGSSNPFE